MDMKEDIARVSETGATPQSSTEYNNELTDVDFIDTNNMPFASFSCDYRGRDKLVELGIIEKVERPSSLREEKIVLSASRTSRRQLRK
jgi:hypothetical protein